MAAHWCEVYCWFFQTLALNRCDIIQYLCFLVLSTGTSILCLTSVFSKMPHQQSIPWWFPACIIFTPYWWKMILFNLFFSQDSSTSSNSYLMTWTSGLPPGRCSHCTWLRHGKAKCLAAPPQSQRRHGCFLLSYTIDHSCWIRLWRSFPLIRLICMRVCVKVWSSNEARIDNVQAAS